VIKYVIEEQINKVYVVLWCIVRWGLTDVCRIKSPNVIVAWLLFLECLVLQMKEMRSFEKSESTHPTVRHHIADD